VKHTRRVIPTFEASILNDPQKGLQSLLHKLEKIEDSALDAYRESVSLMMRIYQGWVYNLFTADFGDMCWKMDDRKHLNRFRIFPFVKIFSEYSEEN
jgi:hypothetical protein